MADPLLTQEQVKELQPLYSVVHRELSKPVVLTTEGAADLAARITAAVAVYMGGVVPSSPQELRAMADAMERLQRRVTGALLPDVPELCVCTHPWKDHDGSPVCTAVRGRYGTLGCGCLGWRVR